MGKCFSKNTSPVLSLGLMYRYFHGFCSWEHSSLILSLVSTRMQTRSSYNTHQFAVQLQKPRISKSCLHCGLTYLPMFLFFRLNFSLANPRITHCKSLPFRWLQLSFSFSLLLHDKKNNEKASYGKGYINHSKSFIKLSLTI